MIRKLLILLVRFYQKAISPMTGPHCKYHPTCSQYMIDALRMHGPLLGLLMGIARILRCNPFARGGIDYVPLKFSLRKNLDETYNPPESARKRRQQQKM